MAGTDLIRNTGALLERTTIAYRVLGDTRTGDMAFETQTLFADHNSIGVEPFLVAISERTGLPVEDVVVVGGAVRAARRLGLSYDTFHDRVEELLDADLTEQEILVELRGLGSACE